MSVLTSNLLLLLTAGIWGFAFVAQRVGMDYVGPFTFNGIRFALGACSLLPLIFFLKQKNKDENYGQQEGTGVVGAGILAGSVLFLGASLQQIGLVYTTAGKAAFITCLYIVFVPMIGIFFKQYISLTTWLGSIITIAGLYILCVKDTSFLISYGELLELIGSLFWTIHILLIDRFSRKVNVLQLSFIQFMTCAILSMITALFIETISLISLQDALVPILYGGIASVGIAYTLQVVGQKNAQPSHAAIILSMETVFAAIGGWIILNEKLTSREVVGCGIMLAGMLLSQLTAIKQSQAAANEIVIELPDSELTENRGGIRCD